MLQTWSMSDYCGRTDKEVGVIPDPMPIRSWWEMPDPTNNILKAYLLRNISEEIGEEIWKSVGRVGIFGEVRECTKLVGSGTLQVMRLFIGTQEMCVVLQLEFRSVGLCKQPLPA